MNESNRKQLDLGEADVGRLMRKYAIPCIVSLLVGALYNTVDPIFIANAVLLSVISGILLTVIYLVFSLSVSLRYCLIARFQSALPLCS